MLLLTKIFGSRNQRLLKQYQKIVFQINALEAVFEKKSDVELQAQTCEFKRRVADGVALNTLLPEAFAVCREASRRVLKMRHFDVQLLGGMALHFGKIAEMCTGEGKTLMATLPVYLNTLSGEGVHVVTVNDYLAQRDAEWMGKLYRWLGLTIGINSSKITHSSKQHAYSADVTYGTNNEFGFDYLRDNMVFHKKDRVQRNLNFAIVDEVDSILIDEARTPLIISGQAENHTELYQKMNQVPALLILHIDQKTKNKTENIIQQSGDYIKDEKNCQVLLTEVGYEKAEKILTNMNLLPVGASLYDAANILLIQHLYAALRAHVLYYRNQHYVVQNGEVIIVDEFTGRLMPGRRWSDGLHQAVEAKEKVNIQNENQILASITFQNYFRMYKKLSGMTGTADTEAYEFQEIYNLETVVIPSNCPNARRDYLDQVYKTSKEKYCAILQDIQECYQRGQPVLVGTTSIENSELLSNLLNRSKLPHNVLNAKQHVREAEIIAQAGRPNMITIATNMAGRGTDIVLGGNVVKQIELVEADKNISIINKKTYAKKLITEWHSLHHHVINVGGLHIIGTERHESRRIDNQLRGRAGRQGDPGSSRFYLSLDDALLRIFAGDRVQAMMNRLKMPEGEPIEAGIISRSIESAQRKVEARNFDIRKQLLEYDDVANDQRRVIYQQRNELLEAQDMSEIIALLRDNILTNVFRLHVPENSIKEEWDLSGLDIKLHQDWQLTLSLKEILDVRPYITDIELLETILSTALSLYTHKVSLMGKDNFNCLERNIMLHNIDMYWREHLAALDYMRQGIHLRGYAQMNPKQEYKREAFQLFSQMLDTIKYETIRTIMVTHVNNQKTLAFSRDKFINQDFCYQKSNLETYTNTPFLDRQDKRLAISSTNTQTQSLLCHVDLISKVGRNDICPCGSSKKYKQCHGRRLA